MNLVEKLKKINPNILEFIHQDIVDSSGHIIGSRCYGMNDKHEAFSGGTASSRDTALRIAVAEAFERSLFYKIAAKENLKQEFDVINFPSTSGFAAGFDDNFTRFRAICEGVERWAWSKWIDGRCKIAEVKSDKKLSKLTMHLLSDFKECMWFKKDFEVTVSVKEKINLSLVIFLGITENGVFPGSRVSTEQDELYEHPVIEAHRNLINFKLHQNNPKECRDIIEKRTMFFGDNKKIALAQINNAVLDNWPRLELHLLKRFETNIPEVSLYRCLFKDFIGWHEGDIERFVY